MTQAMTTKARLAPTWRPHHLDRHGSRHEDLARYPLTCSLRLLASLPSEAAPEEALRHPPREGLECLVDEDGPYWATD